MKSKIAFSVIGLITMLLGACTGFDNSISGNGNVITEYHEVGEFHGIEAASGLNVFVEFGEMSSEVEVIADENLHEFITIEVSRGVLSVKSRRSIRNASSKDVFIKAGKLDEIEVSSAAEFIGENRLLTEDIDIEISSAADLDLELDAGTLRIDISSSGSADLRGKADRLIAECSSAGDLNAFDLIVEEGEIEVSSAADANVHVTKKLKAEASSAGNIRYEGNPSDKNIESSSAGNVSGR